MQDDDVTNPAVLWLLDGEELWNRKAGAAGQACAGLPRRCRARA